jgi:hypothetical protein
VPVVRNGQAVAAFSPAAAKYIAAILSTHPFAEAMFVDSSSFGWLVRPFHFMRILYNSGTVFSK